MNVLISFAINNDITLDKAEEMLLTQRVDEMQSSWIMESKGKQRNDDRLQVHVKSKPSKAFMENMAVLFNLKHCYYHKVYVFNEGDSSSSSENSKEETYEQFSIRNYIVDETVKMLKRKEQFQEEMRDSVTAIQDENNKELNTLNKQLEKLLKNQDHLQEQFLVMQEALTELLATAKPKIEQSLQ